MGWLDENEEQEEERSPPPLQEIPFTKQAY